MAQPKPAWRSLLYVPANVDRFIAKAPDSGADGIILDLEDSIAAAAKAEAREGLGARVENLTGKGPDVLVRINAPWRLCVRDLEAAVRPGVSAILCPKICAPYQIRAIGEIVGELEAERGMAAGTVRLIALVEDAEGVFALEAIALAEPRLISVNLGIEDLAADLGVDPSLEGGVLAQAKYTAILASRRAGLEPMGLVASMADFRDLERLEAVARRSREAGFVGASCIHPAQVPVLNRAFSPEPDALDWAREVQAAFEEADARGSASVAVRGAMVDVPVYRRALRILARAPQGADGGGR